MPVEHRPTSIAWLLVAVQGTLIAAIVVLPRDPGWDGEPAVDIVAWGLIVLGSALGLWAARHLGRGLTPLPLPNGAVELITHGPYRLMRHPIYTAVMLGMSGVALRTRTPIVLAVAIGLIGFLNWKARWEERHLAAAFEGYEAYANRTTRFVPFWLHRWGGRPGSGGPIAR